MSSLLSELKRRNVFKVAAAYAVVGWLLAQVIAVINEPLALPHWFDTVALLTIIFGFPIALILAWAYEMTPKGVRRTRSAAPEMPPRVGSELATIAVLPFKDLGGSAGGMSLAEAIPFELHNSLTRVSKLRVVPVQSAVAHTGTGKGMHELAAALGVKYVVGGTVGHAGTRVRVVAELYDAYQDKLLWSQRFETSTDKVFDTQQQIAAAIAIAFGGERLRLELEEAQGKPPSDMAAWELVQKARAYLLHYSSDAVREAVPLLKRAVAKDGTYAGAHAHLGLVIAESTLNGISANPADDRVRALESVNRAVDLAASDPGVLRAAGAAHAYCGSNAMATTLLKRAVELAPYDLGSWGYLGWPLTASGNATDLDRLHRILNRLLRQAPKHPGYPYWLFHKAVAFACQQKYAESEKLARRAIAAQPRFGLAHMTCANALGASGQHDAARLAADDCRRINAKMTPAFYADLVEVLADSDSVVACRTLGLRRAGLLE